MAHKRQRYHWVEALCRFLTSLKSWMRSWIALQPNGHNWGCATLSRVARNYVGGGQEMEDKGWTSDFFTCEIKTTDMQKLQLHGSLSPSHWSGNEFHLPAMLSFFTQSLYPWALHKGSDFGPEFSSHSLSFNSFHPLPTSPCAVSFLSSFFLDWSCLQSLANEQNPHDSRWYKTLARAREPPGSSKGPYSTLWSSTFPTATSLGSWML